MQHFPQVGQPVVDLTGTPGMIGLPVRTRGSRPLSRRGATGGRGAQISDEELANQLTMFQCLDCYEPGLVHTRGRVFPVRGRSAEGCKTDIRRPGCSGGRLRQERDGVLGQVAGERR